MTQVSGEIGASAGQEMPIRVLIRDCSNWMFYMGKNWIIVYWIFCVSDIQQIIVNLSNICCFGFQKFLSHFLGIWRERALLFAYVPLSLILLKNLIEYLNRLTRYKNKNIQFDISSYFRINGLWKIILVQKPFFECFYAYQKWTIPPQFFFVKTSFSYLIIGRVKDFIGPWSKWWLTKLYFDKTKLVIWF